ncbi:hypothetical protein TNIN_140971 [Trichonephila inaurata madagascariensis]|uniref:Uncharacterized protein n=1 Tax=Trichonephila inaurata madagascariensis TaxID=2747483 RepID=A0A8X6Y5R2_9ARAC|nr:hypothetical protein TNIN_140971 [Trichonephila inaurata madagascariensis]
MDNAPDYGSGDSRFESWLARASLLLAWASGATDNAPDYGSGDSRFESWLARCFGGCSSFLNFNEIQNLKLTISPKNIESLKTYSFYLHGPVAQRITRLTTDQEIPGSNPGLLGASLLLAWASGAMDNASDYGSGDSRFEFWLASCFGGCSSF